MSKLTVKQYATINGITVQSVYKRVKTGSLETVEVGNTKYIVVDDEQPQQIKKLRDRKIPIIVDCSIDIKHLTLLATDWGTYKLFSKIMGGKNNGIGK